MIDYIPADLNKKQTRLIIKAAEHFGIGRAFMPSQIRSNILDFRAIAAAGYAKSCSTGWSCNAFYLTEKCQPVIDANN